MNAPPRARVATVVLAPVRAYQKWISPGLPPTCRFRPTCSAYAVQAVTERGVLRGFALAGWRLLRCNPWHPGGQDPVPPSRRATTASRSARTHAESEPPC